MNPSDIGSFYKRLDAVRLNRIAPLGRGHLVIGNQGLVIYNIYNIYIYIPKIITLLYMS